MNFALHLKQHGMMLRELNLTPRWWRMQGAKRSSTSIRSIGIQDFEQKRMHHFAFFETNFLSQQNLHELKFLDKLALWMLPCHVSLINIDSSATELRKTCFLLVPSIFSQWWINMLWFEKQGVDFETILLTLRRGLVCHGCYREYPEFGSWNHDLDSFLSSLSE